MRLLLDSKTGKPVLFQDRLYKNPGVPDVAEKAIDTLFLQRAKELNIPLIGSSGDENGAAYQNDIESLNSPAPFEYVDAGRKGVTNGRFTIPANQTVLLFMPKAG